MVQRALARGPTASKTPHDFGTDAFSVAYFQGDGQNCEKIELAYGEATDNLIGIFRSAPIPDYGIALGITKSLYSPPWNIPSNLIESMMYPNPFLQSSVATFYSIESPSRAFRKTTESDGSLSTANKLRFGKRDFNIKLTESNDGTSRMILTDRNHLGTQRIILHKDTSRKLHRLQVLERRNGVPKGDLPDGHEITRECQNLRAPLAHMKAYSGGIDEPKADGRVSNGSVSSSKGNVDNTKSSSQEIKKTAGQGQ